jgi:hypothetical protein
MLALLVCKLNPIDAFDAAVLTCALDTFGKLSAPFLYACGITGAGATFHEDNGVERSKSRPVPTERGLRPRCCSVTELLAESCV